MSPVDQTPKPLNFEDDKGAGRSTWIALSLLILIVGWMGSGFIFPSEQDETVLEKETVAPVAVAVTSSQAKSVTQFYQAEGQALPDRDTLLRARTSGDIAEVLIQKGQDVAAGDIIARFVSTENEADINQATEELAAAQRELDNAQRLLDRGVATTDRVVDARSALASAQARLTTVQKSSEDLVITAPFGGRVETLDLDVGEYVSAGTEIGRLVDNTPLSVAIQVPQQQLTRIKDGQKAAVQFITGEQREGVVSFVGTSASAETRTFLAEIEVANADGAIPAGISAEISIPTGETKAHFLSPSIVSLNTDGALGVKTVGENNIVEFHPIAVTRAQLDGIWVTGLPDDVDIITVGQGFVNAGETVDPQAGEPAQ